MSEETWTADELFEGLTLQPGFIAELEKLGLIRVVARDGAGSSLYSADARDELEKVLALVELGYQPKDIAAIAKRVGLPAKKRGFFRRLPMRLRSAELARRTGVAVERIDGWIADGRLSAALVSEAGDGLFGRDALDRVRLIADLEDAGVDGEQVTRVLACADLAPGQEITVGETEDALAFIVELAARLRARKASIRRLERSLGGLRRGLIRAGRAVGGKRARRRGSRRRARAATTGRQGDGGASGGE